MTYTIPKYDILLKDVISLPDTYHRVVSETDTNVAKTSYFPRFFLPSCLNETHEQWASFISAFARSYESFHSEDKRAIEAASHTIFYAMVFVLKQVLREQADQTTPFVTCCLQIIGEGNTLDELLCCNQYQGVIAHLKWLTEELPKIEKKDAPQLHPALSNTALIATLQEACHDAKNTKAPRPAARSLRLGDAAMAANFRQSSPSPH